MNKGFELKNLNKGFFKEDYESYIDIGRNTFEQYKRTIDETLNSFKTTNGSLDGDKMQSSWFPVIEADIFLSHSHEDRDLVVALAGWLKNKFGLSVFIDSCIWEYYKKLQVLLDKEYSKIKGAFSYDKVLYAASHVNMMLNTALMQMIDNCEFVIFVNTPNSVKPGDVVKNVVSPWIYSELAMTKLIRKSEKKLLESTEDFSDLSVRYNLNTDHLTQLNLLYLNTRIPIKEMNRSEFISYLNKL